jgi:hypothetical protein
VPPACGRAKRDFRPLLSNIPMLGVSQFYFDWRSIPSSGGVQLYDEECSFWLAILSADPIPMLLEIVQALLGKLNIILVQDLDSVVFPSNRSEEIGHYCAILDPMFAEQDLNNVRCQ